jgi:uncharacterized protein
MRRAAIGLILAAAAPVSAQNGDVPPGPSITVSGIGKVETMPDLAEINLGIRGEGASPDAATRAMVAKQQAVLDGLASLGDGRMRVRTGNVSVNAARAGDCGGEDDDDDKVHLSTGKCAITGYVAGVSVTIEMAAVKDAGTAVGLAARLGASNPHMSDFHLSQTGDAARRANAAAIADARAKAEAIAGAAGERLGPILKVIDNDSHPGGYDDVIVTGLRRNAPPPSPVAVDIRPEPVQTIASLSVTFAIQH